jgi:hypothetical protein
MARIRGKTLTQDELNCPVCNYDYSKTNLAKRFFKAGNIFSISFNCECDSRLLLRSMSRYMKIYDATEMRRKQYLKAKMDRIKLKENGGS